MTKATQIIKLRSAGVPYSAIMDKVDCCHGYISAVVQRHNAGGQRLCDRRASAARIERRKSSLSKKKK